jgi:uncharacterized protein (DUF302 family)
MMDAFEATVEQTFDATERAVREALAEEGFGILSEIDIAGTLEAKLGVKRPALKILGACNPSIAEQALSLEPGLALLLPCNVVVEDAGQGRTRVAIADPRALLAATGNAGAELAELAARAASSLERAVGGLAG